jgi:hypothetical protein
VGRFVKKEQLRMVVVLEGRPLREAADGETYQDVEVRYAEKGGSSGKHIIALARKHMRRGAVTVITGSRKLEEECLKLGLEVVRGSTFKKGLDGGNGGGDSGSDQRKRRPRRRRPQRSDASEGRTHNGGAESDGKKADKVDDGGVSELLDLVE